MAEFNKNSDNEQTVYMSADNVNTISRNPFDKNNQRSQQSYPHGNAAGQQIYGDMYANKQQAQPTAPYGGRQQGYSQPQTPASYGGQQQGYSQPQTPAPYGGQPQGYSQPQSPAPYGGQPQGYSQQPQNMYGNQAGYNAQRMYQTPSPAYSKKKKSGNSGLIILVIIAVLLLSAIAGVILVMLFNNKDDDSGNDSLNEITIGEDSDKKKDDDDDLSSIIETTSAEPETESPELRRYSMPNVCGINGAEAEKLLEDAGFVVEIVEENSEETKDTVIRQSVPEKTVVVEGTEIILYVSKGSEEVSVPDVRGRSFEDAKNELEKIGLLVNTEYAESDSVPAGSVISQDIAPETKLKKGASVLLVVSTGSTTPQNQQGRVVTKETDLNVRKGPDKGYDVIGMVAKGSIVEIVGMEGDWYKIVFKNSFGYVSKDYIELVN